MEVYCPILWLLLATVWNISDFTVSGAKADVAQMRQLETLANVVTFTFCESSLPSKEKVGKKTLEEVHTYAELKNDASASFPDSFTLCSTIMTEGCQSYWWPTFFNILDDRAEQFMVSYISNGLFESK